MSESQPSGSQERPSTADNHTSARPGEPPIVETPLSLTARVVLYYKELGLDINDVQQLVSLKTQRQNTNTTKGPTKVSVTSTSRK